MKPGSERSRRSAGGLGPPNGSLGGGWLPLRSRSRFARSAGCEEEEGVEEVNDEVCEEEAVEVVVVEETMAAVEEAGVEEAEWRADWGLLTCQCHQRCECTSGAGRLAISQVHERRSAGRPYR